MRDMANYYAALVDITVDLSVPKTGIYVESSMTALYLNTHTQRAAACNTLRAVFPEWSKHDEEAGAFAFNSCPAPYHASSYPDAFCSTSQSSGPSRCTPASTSSPRASLKRSR
jgi:hypothetical protein